VAVTLPLWDGGRTRLEAAEAGERAAASRTALAELEGAVALQVLQARLGVMDAQDRADTLRRAVIAAEELLRATELRLNAGRATALELVTARATLRRAELDEARARYDLQIAWAELRHAMGTGDAR
jgi:outer membrane protein TolC